MDMVTRALLHTGRDKEKQNMIWNMAGSLCYALASMVLSFLVMRIAGSEEGGIFAFAFSTLGQQMFLVAYFGIRPFQITDGNYEFTFADYLSHRIVTCGAAAAAGALYLAVSGYSAYKAAIIFLMVLYKVIDGFADVYESEFQRSGNLYLTGKSNTFRTLLSVFSFLSCLLSSGNLLLSCVVAVAAQVLGVALFDLTAARCLPDFRGVRIRGSSKKIFERTFFLFLSVFLDFYIFSSSKYAIDRGMGDVYSGYFNVIFMPTSFINLAAGFVIRPFLTSLTDLWNSGEMRRFRDLTGKILAVISAITLAATAGCLLLGKPVLVILERLLGEQYRGVISGYGGPFVVIVLGGGFYAVMNLMYYALVIMRRQRMIFILYSAVTVLAYFASDFFVSAYGIWGAAVSYLILMIVLAAGFGLTACLVYWKEKCSYAE